LQATHEFVLNQAKISAVFVSAEESARFVDDGLINFGCAISLVVLTDLSVCQ
jgi:hypothetical protein